MADPKKYISVLSGQTFLTQMDMARRARLEQLKILGTGYKEQIGTLNPALGIYTGGWDPNAEMPDPAATPYDMLDPDWDKLYKSMQLILRDMANDKSVTKDNKDAEQLLTNFYGTGLLIEKFSVSSALTTIVGVPAGAAFTTFLDDPTLRIWLEDEISQDDQDALLSALRDGSYVGKPNILRTLRHVCRVIYNDAASGAPTIPVPCPFTIPQIYTIYNNTTVPEPPTPANVTNFKNNHREIFKRLVEKPKALEAFASKDNDGIAKAISTGINNNNYKEGKFALAPLDEQSLNLFQRAENKIDYIKNDMLGKVAMRHKRHPYYMDETAQPIMESLFVTQKPKFDITTGLDGFLKKIDAIKGDLGNSPKAVPHLEYMEKTLKAVKKSLPKEFSGALKDSQNMQGIVDAIIDRAGEDGKIDEAQTLLECLAMMRYGYFTSATRDKIGKENLILLGDPGLSFNKNNQAIQMITKSFDKAAKAVVMLGTNAVVAGHNTWKRRKLYFEAGSDKVKMMHDAKQQLSTMGPITPALIATLNTNVQTAKQAYEIAARAANPNESEIKRLEKEWKMSEMVLQTAQQTDPITGDRKPDSKLTKKQDLMAFWNYVNNPSKSGRDLNIFKNTRSAQNYQNEIMATGRARKVDNLTLLQQQFYDRSIAA